MSRLRVGIVGLPNVGKSTLFNAVTRTKKAEAQNYPFCTIEPNVGMVVVPDPRLDALSSLSRSEKIIPTTIEFVDIAGLVQGASQGEGLGNQFLSHIREVDAILQVVRCFESTDIHHVSGSVDPLRDIEVIQTELLLADTAALEKRQDKLVKKARGGEKQAQEELALCQRLLPHLDQGKPASTLDCSDSEKVLLRSFFLLTAKPTLFGCNVAEKELEHADKLPHVQKVREYVAQHHHTQAIAISAQIEADLAELSPEEAIEFLHDLGVQESGVDSLIRTTYTLLGLDTFLTTGEKETRAWTIPHGARAPQAAGVIHSDFERGFIAAECIHYQDLITLGSWAKARETGKLRVEGKEYVVQDGDVVEFRFNV